MKELRRKLGELIRRTYREFTEDGGPVMAAAVAYFGLLSVFPLLLLTLTIMGRMLGSELEAKEALASSASDLLPGGHQTVHSMIGTLVGSHGFLSGLALVGLVWTGSQILYYLEVAMNRAWDCPPRPWWQSRLRSIGFLIIAEVAVVVYFGISVVSLAKKALATLPGYSWLSTDLLLSGMLWLTSFLLSLLVLVALNRFLPNHDVSWTAAFVGGAVSAVLFEAARLSFRYYLNEYASYDLLYGSIGGMVIIMVWTYYGAAITLIGAELASELEEVFLDRERERHRTSRALDEEALEVLREAGIEVW